MSEHRLGEILIERPRHGMRISAKKITGYKKTLCKLTQVATEDGLLSPYLIKIRNRTKGLSDHISPLRRYLRSQVGRSWNDVYSELCLQLDTSTMTGQHVFQHVWDYVERHVEIIDGIVYRKPYQDPRWDRLDTKYGDRFYIDPDTRILCQVRKKSKRTTQRPCDRLILDDYHQYRKLDGIWYLVTFKNLESDRAVRDAILKVFITPRIADIEYGRQVYAASKVQCSKREIKFIEA
jgi:hypothetical protein